MKGARCNNHISNQFPCVCTFLLPVCSLETRYQWIFLFNPASLIHSVFKEKFSPRWLDEVDSLTCLRITFFIWAGLPLLSCFKSNPVCRSVPVHCYYGCSLECVLVAAVEGVTVPLTVSQSTLTLHKSSFATCCVHCPVHSWTRSHRVHSWLRGRMRAYIHFHTLSSLYCPSHSHFQGACPLGYLFCKVDLAIVYL